MSIVLTDVPVVTATLVSTSAPQPVQVVISGLTAGASVVLTGTAGGSSWAVPGGSFVSDGSQAVLIDNRAPLNTPVVYEALVEGGAYVSTPITVPFAGEYILQSLDGRTRVEFVWVDDGVPREFELRGRAFSVPGRRRPPIRYVPGGDGGGSVTVRTETPEATRALGDLLVAGRPLVLRTDGNVRDLPPVEIILPLNARNALRGGGPVSKQRLWTISYLLVDDPEPGTPLAAWTWADFDAAWSGSTWGSFDAYFAGMTWEDFDRFDWGLLL